MYKEQVYPLSGHHSLFSVHMLCLQAFGCLFTALSATRTSNSHNHSYVHYALYPRANVITRMYASLFTGNGSSEWF